MLPRTRAFLQIHLCVVLWGFTAILGKLITLAALPLVWWRMTLVAITLCMVPRFWRGLRGMPARLLAIYAGIGIVVALHWLTFYGAVKLANASVAATCMALTPIFIAFIEPTLSGGRVRMAEIGFGIAVIPGVMLVVGGTPDSMHAGILIGALSALLVAIFAILNKRFIMRNDTLTITGIEMAAGAVFLAIAGRALFSGESFFSLPSLHDSLLLFALATACTLLPFALSLLALRELSTFSMALVVNLEPVYAIGLAILVLGEQRELTASFYLGVAMIFAIVFLHPWWSARRAAASS